MIIERGDDPNRYTVLNTPEELQAMLLRIERAGRTCYQSYRGKDITVDSAADFCRMLLRRGHESVLEHSSITVRFERCSRGFCYDDQTEVWTRKGWRLFKDVKSDDEFLTYRLESRRIEYQQSVGSTVENWASDLIYAESSMVDLAVTPNHRMVHFPYDVRRDRRWKIAQAKDIEGKRVKFLRGSLPGTVWEDEHAPGALLRIMDLLNVADTHENHWSRRYYRGKVYCVTVPNGTLYVRRNGKACWSGNTHEMVRHRLCAFCLSGETEVVAYRHPNAKGTSQKKWKLRDLHRWQDDPKRKGRLRLIRLRSVDADGVLVPGRIKTVMATGTQLTYQLKTRSGRMLRATGRHRILTPNGWRRVEELHPGDRVVANGIRALANAEWLRTKYLTENHTLEEMAVLVGCSPSTVTKALRRHGINKPLSMRKNRKPGRGRRGMFSDHQRREISQRMSGEGNPQWKGEAVGPRGGRIRAWKQYTPDVCWGCGTSKKVERHHCDEDPTNNKSENILFLCRKCHHAFHHGPGVLTVFSDEVLAITPHGEEETFDVEMEDSPHNFVADGIVVHNSQESTRYVDERESAIVAPPSREDEPAFHDAAHYAFDSYRRLREAGWPPQDARQVLPIGVTSEIVVTANFREWRHIFRMRTSRAAHWEIRSVMVPLLQELQVTVPGVFEDFEESGTCRDGIAFFRKTRSE